MTKTADRLKELLEEDRKKVEKYWSKRTPEQIKKAEEKWAKIDWKKKYEEALAHNRRLAKAKRRKK